MRPRSGSENNAKIFNCGDGMRLHRIRSMSKAMGRNSNQKCFHEMCARRSCPFGNAQQQQQQRRHQQQQPHAHPIIAQTQTQTLFRASPMYKKCFNKYQLTAQINKNKSRRHICVRAFCAEVLVCCDCCGRTAFALVLCRFARVAVIVSIVAARS